MAREEWDRSNGFDSLRLQGMLRENSPDLALILQHSGVMLIGEPGLGKTWLARRCAVELADKESATRIRTAFRVSGQPASPGAQFCSHRRRSDDAER